MKNYGAGLLALGAGLAVATGMAQIAEAQGAGASVDWELTAAQPRAVFYDAPPNFDKHYRVCFQEPPATGKLVLVLADRQVEVSNERCIDVVSNKISLSLEGSEQTVTGLFYLVE